MTEHLKRLRNNHQHHETSSGNGEGLHVELELLRQRVAELEQCQTENAEFEKRSGPGEDHHRNLVENSQDLMFVCDHHGRFIFVNKAWEQCLGFTMEEVMRHRISDLQSPDVAQRDMKFFSNRLLNGPINGYETTLISRTGTTVHLSFNIIPLRDSEGSVTGIQGTAHNISERKKMETEYLRIQKLESIGTLAGGIAHDFNNLLQAILGNIQLAKRTLKPDDKSFEWLTSAEKASDLAKDLSYRLLTFAKGGEPFKQVTAITKLLRETVQLALSGSNISVEFFLDENLYPLEIDEGQMKQVISNIVINAKEVMPKGGHLTINAHNVLAHELVNPSLRDRNYVHISIEDQGIGITPKNISRVFDPYFTTKGMGSEKGKGLGLTICHSIITKHDGIISIDSIPGVKTVVHIYLPEADKLYQPMQNFPAITEPRKERILLMDDEDFVRSVTSEMLEQLGYEVQLASNGDEAIETYCKSLEEGKSFDAVILDLTIPGGTGGDEAILRLLDIDPNVKGILSSGYADNNVMNDFREFGFQGVIAKPFNFEELANVVASIVRRPS
ncbi:MAG: domain S-box [Deltaproteobacteria bacterium]|nr:domain S-box [Deltaproteobacteria bacterium]